MKKYQNSPSMKILGMDALIFECKFNSLPVLVYLSIIKLILQKKVAFCFDFKKDMQHLHKNSSKISLHHIFHLTT